MFLLHKPARTTAADVSQLWQVLMVEPTPRSFSGATGSLTYAFLMTLFILELSNTFRCKTTPPTPTCYCEEWAPRVVPSEWHLDTHNRVIVGVIPEERAVAVGYNRGYIISGSVKVTHQSWSIRYGSSPASQKTELCHAWCFCHFCMESRVRTGFSQKETDVLVWE